MFATLARSTLRYSSQRGYKVAVLGAAGGIGQPLSLLLKLDPRVTELSLFDVVRTPGVAADISHCSTPAKVTGYTGNEEIGAALTGSDVVVIPAGNILSMKLFCILPVRNANVSMSRRSSQAWYDS